jgi:ATP-dependent DNA helicase RecG
MQFSTPLHKIPSIKKQSLEKLEHLGIHSVEDLFLHLPHRYEDYSVIVPIQDLVVDEKQTVVGVISKLKTGKSFQKKMLITEAHIIDSNGDTLRVIWFNQRFIAQSLKVDLAIRVSGKVTQDRNGLLMTSPALERASRDATHTGRLVPIYNETRGLTSKFFRWQLATLFPKIDTFPDPLPDDLRQSLHLPTLKTSLAYFHFPKNPTEPQLASKRFAFDEMLLVQLKALQMKALFETSKAKALKLDKKVLSQFLNSLPFTLTKAQTKALKEILHDLSKAHPMNRLLNGDVGSGKTILAAIAALAAATNGTQVAILAPTEILARQHYENLAKLFDSVDESVALFTGSYRILHGQGVTRKTLQGALSSGIVRVVVGTHALLSEDVTFQNLSLIVVDEQHRFGVAQRAKLQDMSFQSKDGSSSLVPHFLTMTATPIPRTLSLAFFGNLDISILDELPHGRLPITTKVARSESARAKIYEFINQEVSKGRQAFIIFPLVEESLAMKDVKAAVIEHEKLTKKVFPHLNVGLIHGKLKAKEKEVLMHDFKEKKYDILVATAVIEVGIDIPNATIILIEEAERFGLAQLHQFRGRVGRSNLQSYCFLFAGSQTGSLERLRVLERETSGFAIAEADLGIRGPGAFFGTRQSGLPDIAMENLTNMKLISITRDIAQSILSEDPTLTKNPLLKTALKRFEERIHLE